MKQIIIRNFIVASGTLGLLAVGLVAPASALSASGSSSADQTKLNLIISKGNSEINRRLTTLNTLTSKINSAQRLSTADKASLSSEVASEISGLTSLKAQLDAATDLTTARNDAQSIFSDYRVYALIVPKVKLVKTADDQQVAETNLASLATKLQSRLTADQTAGKDVSNLQAVLNDLNSKVSAAQTISRQIETAVIGLQPSDYNANHTVLSGDRDQLQTAQSDVKAAHSDVQQIINGLKTLK